MRQILKAIIIFLGIILFIGIFALVRIIFSSKKRGRYISYLLHYFSKILVWILGIRIELHEEVENFKKEGIFFVSNHLSYLDGIITSSLYPFLFIGKSELKNWPLLGILFSFSETIFVDRINIFNIKEELNKIQFLLNQKVNLILFPEGTSGDGTKILPFKSSFFEAPLKSKCKIVPLLIKYKKINNQLLNENNKDLVYWYGDMEFFPHFLKVLGLKRIEVKVRVFHPLEIKEKNKQPSTLNRKDLSNAFKDLMTQHLKEEIFS